MNPCRSSFSIVARYKKAAAIVFITVAASSASAENLDAAGAVLCLDGAALGGTPGGACVGYMAKYFSIVPMRHGHPDFNAMIKARNAFTAQCTSCPADARKTVSDRYGDKMGL